MLTERAKEQIERAVAGDQVALDALLASYHERLLRVVDRHLPADLRAVISAEDVAQEAYATVFRDIGKFELRQGDSFFSWLCKLAENRLVDMIRAQRSQKRGGAWNALDVWSDDKASSAVMMLEFLARHSRTPSQSVAERQNADAVKEALEQLPADYRQALELRYLEVLPVAEIAQRMGRSEGSVHQLCHRGLHKLQAIMGSFSDFFSRGA